MAELDLALVLPVAILSAWGLLVLLMTPFLRETGRGMQALVSPWSASLLGVAFAGWACLRQWAAAGPIAGKTAYGMVHVDRFGVYLSLLVLTVGFMTLLLSARFLEREEAEHGEFYGLTLFALAGMVLMLETTNLMMVLIGLEIFSVTLYVLCGVTRGRARSVEAALKYFLLGAFSSGFLVYGLALVYGSVGSLELAEIAKSTTVEHSPMLALGLGLVIVGLAFKIAIVPFHQWVPDVYTGAPTNVTGFMAAATKTAALAALIRVLAGAFGQKTELWVPLVTWLAVATMTVANLIALAQTNIKRLLAFSSIAHAGYLLIALVCLPDLGVRAIVYYLTAYAFMTVGAFAVAAAVGSGDASGERGYDFVSSWAGLGHRRPWLAAAMTVFLLSMAGIPPTGGFFGKYLIFQAAVESKQWMLAIVGSLNAVIAAYYYLGVILTMWFKEAGDDAAEPSRMTPGLAVVLTIAVAAVVYLGVAPGRVLALFNGVTSSLI
ncbi:MAG TPA: NADH-quinone oxidoreductase subunit N [Candidatus Polarisedimenticolaceae bacterium]|nr:NADH-quinone oxidoreductase subunit N [Candidatus Polarisedimenticolaceae bacterium]